MAKKYVAKDRVALKENISYRGSIYAENYPAYTGDENTYQVQWDNGGNYMYVADALIPEKEADKLLAGSSLLKNEAAKKEAKKAAKKKAKHEVPIAFMAKNRSETLNDALNEVAKIKSSFDKKEKPAKKKPSSIADIKAAIKEKFSNMDFSLGRPKT